MKNLSGKPAANLCAALITVCFVTNGAAQETNHGEPTVRTPSPATDEIPASAMMTAHGRQLATRLRMLRYSESRMGPKHPSLPAIQSQIASVKEQLAALGPEGQQKLRTGGQAVLNSVQSMSNEELRELVVRMAITIEMLEFRLQKLEKQMEIH